MTEWAVAMAHRSEGKQPWLTLVVCETSQKPGGLRWRCGLVRKINEEEPEAERAYYQQTEAAVCSHE
jgi:hypothetical protein